MKKEILVIGGGAAGMMAAIEAARQGCAVQVVEQNEKTGKKLFITGKGRCNFTNDCTREVFFDSVLSNPKFLYSAYAACSPQDMIRFFESSGMPVKVERGRRAFPVSDRSADVIDTLRAEMKRHGVRVRLHTKAVRILTEEENGRMRACGVRCREEGGNTGYDLKADAVILAAGGLAYPATGARGEGYLLAEELGHSITPLSPSLVPFRLREKAYCAALAGLSPKNVRFTVLRGEKAVFSETGEMLFTHEGISGPLVLSASARLSGTLEYAPYTGREKICIPNAPQTAGKPFSCAIDWKPAVDLETFDERLRGIFLAAPRKEVRNALRGVYPASLIPVLLSMAGIAEEKRTGEMTRQERRRLAALTKEMRFTITGSAGFSEAVITRGGISVKETQPGTMASKLVDGLYFAGEILDVDALTGGYNLQIAWATGKAAGAAAAAYAAGRKEKNE